MPALKNFVYKIVVLLCRLVGISAPPLNPPEMAGIGTEAGGSSNAAAAVVTVVERPAAGAGRRRVAMDEWIEEKRGSLLIALSLLMTCAMQASMNPPGGVWTDDGVLVDLAGNVVLKDGKPIYVGAAAAAAAETDVAMYPHRAGYSILARNDPDGYGTYNLLNMQIAVWSGITFVVLISKLNRRHYMFGLVVSGLWACISTTVVNFMYVTYALTPPRRPAANTHAGIFMHPILQLLITSPLPAVAIGFYIFGSDFKAST